MPSTDIVPAVMAAGKQATVSVPPRHRAANGFPLNSFEKRSSGITAAGPRSAFVSARLGKLGRVNVPEPNLAARDTQAVAVDNKGAALDGVARGAGVQRKSGRRHYRQQDELICAWRKAGMDVRARSLNRE